ncbi:hypothetical protein EVAR_47155_1 [Eumeta japonica]|uniref:Uncharacterized protein n=1 Tax=Eumeta variegata TaxID=151549 RepID=A0A4C1XTY0_EUMVA|nr:hypothetical protein EVAR_47155_1 [Eumeta japonica]
MAFFKAIGTFIEDCGLTNIMTESDLIAEENKNLTVQQTVIEYLTAFSQHQDNSPQVQHPETENLLQLYDQYIAETLEDKHDDTHLGLRTEIAKGSFGIRRTNKPFSRIPVDLTLEQTINGEAARRLTGIVNLTSSISARQRWAQNDGARAEKISHCNNLKY